MKPYYDDGKGIVIYHGDCREILPTLPKVDLVLTDPPYGIGMHNGQGRGGRSGFYARRENVRFYEGDWDHKRPEPETITALLSCGPISIIWGGQYFCDVLPINGKWLVWDKENTMPSYSDCELAWTNLCGVSVKKFTVSGNGLMAKETDRFHPTQKPLDLMMWCLSFAPKAETILDPFMGSGTTLRAAKDLGRKAIGIEIEERYCEIAARRLAQEVLQFA